MRDVCSGVILDQSTRLEVAVNGKPKPSDRIAYHRSQSPYTSPPSLKLRRLRPWRDGLVMGVREIDRSLEQWQMGVKDLRRRVILAPTPRERERWYAILLLVQGLTAAATAEALERDPHTIGRWASACGAGGPAALLFEQIGGSPPPLTRRSRRS